MAVRDFLVFRLVGPMAAWGDIAVGERRGTWDVPAKSAILGLLAAGLGIDRADRTAHEALDRGLGFAVRQDRPGRLLRDYHTAQAPKARKNARWSTRRDELNDDDLNTVLSDRLYRTNAIATPAIWRRQGTEGPTLDQLTQALLRPRFTPYLGRKACPLGWPPRPRLLQADGLLAAFDAYDSAEWDAARQFHKAYPGGWPGDTDRPTPVWFEIAAGLDDEDTAALERRQRRDGITNRALWQFTDRWEGRLDWRRLIHGESAP